MILPDSKLQSNPHRVVVYKSSYSSFEELEAEIGDGDRNGFYQATADFMESVLEPGEPDATRYIIKPNVVGGKSEDLANDPDYHGGIVTNAWSVDAIVQRLWDLGARDIVVAEGGGAPSLDAFRENDYFRMMERWQDKGPELTWMSRGSFAEYSEDEITWVDVPDGVVHRKLPFVAPVTGREFLINNPTLKTHNLGVLTGCGKGLQGVLAQQFKHFCSFNDQWGSGHYDEETLAKYYQPDLRESIAAAYKAHVARDLPFWTTYADKKTGVGRFEPHSQRVVDTVLTVNKMYEGRLLNIFEGLIGRDGTAFNQGGDRFVGLLIAGTSIFEVDKVAAWMMGHDPRYIPWLVVGEDRGLGSRDIHDTELHLLPDDRIVTPEELRKHVVRLPVYLHGQSDRLGLGDTLLHDDYVKTPQYEKARVALENI